jgi:hypothetical protein
MAVDATRNKHRIIFVVKFRFSRRRESPSVDKNCKLLSPGNAEEGMRQGRDVDL